MRIINEKVKTVEELFQKITKIKVKNTPSHDRVKQGRYELVRRTFYRDEVVIESYLLTSDGVPLSSVELNAGKDGLSMGRKLESYFARNVHDAKAIYTFITILGFQGKFDTVVYIKERNGNKIVIGNVLD